MASSPILRLLTVEIVGLLLLAGINVSLFHCDDSEARKMIAETEKAIAEYKKMVEEMKLRPARSPMIEI